MGHNKLHLAAFCKNNSCTYGRNHAGLNCPHPFKDQTIGVSVLPGVPFLLQTATFGRPRAGIQVRVANILSEKIGFRLKFIVGHAGIFYPGNRTFSQGYNENLRTGNIEMAGGGIGPVSLRMFDTGFPLVQMRILGVSRAPKAKLPFGNIMKPFPLSTWLAMLVSLLALSTVLVGSYETYEKVSKKLIIKEDAYENFFLFTFCKIAEPEPLPWFKGGIAGKLTVFLWTLLSLFCILFYLSNLRAVMVTTEYEKSIDTLQDILDNGRRVWIDNGFIQLRLAINGTPS